MLSTRKGGFIFFLLNSGMLYFICCLIALVRTSSTILNSSGEGGCLCLVSDPIGKAFSLSPLCVMLAVVFSYIFFVILRKFFSVSNFLNVLIMKE